MRNYSRTRHNNISKKTILFVILFYLNIAEDDITLMTKENAPLAETNFEGNEEKFVL